jgi:hypothetical protein
MLSEGRKRDAAANAILALSFAANAAQSPQALVRSGNVEAPGIQLMSNMMRKRKEANRNLDSGRVSHPARNRKMKTFKEFVEEAYLVEMRKEDKVKGEKKTPLHIVTKTARVERQPEGSDSKWKVKKSENKSLSPRAATGRMKQGMIDKETQPYATRMHGATRHAQGGGGSGAAAPGRLRGVGKLEKQKMEKTPEGERVRPFSAGPSPAQKVALKRAQRSRSTGGGR